jgi:glycosyltransferase involved in cell wall biosynthesis
MKILHLTNSMNPDFGGLSAYLRALVPALIDQGHPSEIVSFDPPDAGYLTALGLPVTALGPVRPGFGYAPRLLPWLREAAARFDVVIVHGLWQYHGPGALRAFPRGTGPRLFVFPHGMLDPWFNRTYPLKHLRKWVFWWLSQRRVLVGAEAVLFTCEEERRLARLSFPLSTYRECVVTFGTAAPAGDARTQIEALYSRHPEMRCRPYWLFLGRITPKKGVDLLIDAYAALAATHPTLPRLVIAGPCKEPEYLQEMQARAAAVCPGGSVLWPGMLTGEVKWGALRAAEVFVLPSHQENFGIAVVEALACGTPVLVSDQVNIWREIVGDGAGLTEMDTPEGVLTLLTRWWKLDPVGRRIMREATTVCFAKRYEIGAVARSLVETLEKTHL